MGAWLGWARACRGRAGRVHGRMAVSRRPQLKKKNGWGSDVGPHRARSAPSRPPPAPTPALAPTTAQIYTRALTSRTALSSRAPTPTGIPKFYRWLSERYPLINQPVLGTRVPEIDNLYLVRR